MQYPLSGGPRRLRRIGAVVVCLALVPGVALAGRTVIAGHEKLTLTGSLQPNRAGAGTRLKLHLDYESTIPGKRLMAPQKDIQLQFPVGLTVRPTAVPQCPIARFNTGIAGSACPRTTILGSGTITADARPALAAPVTGTLTLFNVRGAHNDVVLSVTTKYGRFSYLFNVLKMGRRQVLDARFDHPAAGSTTLFTLKTIDLTLGGGTTWRPYLTNPATCPKLGWVEGLSISSYGGEPKITATTALACRKS